MNAGIYTRGNHKDYDNWAALGNPGWSFKDLLPLFIRAENFLVKDISPGKNAKNFSEPKVNLIIRHVPKIVISNQQMTICCRI